MIITTRSDQYTTIFCPLADQNSVNSFTVGVIGCYTAYQAQLCILTVKCIVFDKTIFEADPEVVNSTSSLFVGQEVPRKGDSCNRSFEFFVKNIFDDCVVCSIIIYFPKFDTLVSRPCDHEFGIMGEISTENEPRLDTLDSSLLKFSSFGISTPKADTSIPGHGNQPFVTIRELQLENCIFMACELLSWLECFRIPQENIGVFSSL